MREIEKPVLITEQKWPNDTVPLVSISCITYNHEKYIKDAIEGFLMQKTTFPVEINIHDDASTDNTANIIREYEEKYPHLINPIYQSENQYSKKDGSIGRIQRGRAKGKYYAPCEGDDYWIDPLKLQKQVEFMEENEDCSMCFHNAMVVYEDSDKISHEFTKLETRKYTGAEILSEWTVPTCSVLLKRKYLDTEKLTNKKYIYGDIILFLLMAEKGFIWCINETMSVYRKHSGGMTSINKNSIDKKKKFIEHHEEIRKNFSQFKEAEDIILSKNYIRLSKLQLRKFKPQFLISLYRGYKQKPELFYNHFIKIYF